jgi:hypothetical protein
VTLKASGAILKSRSLIAAEPSRLLAASRRSAAGAAKPGMAMA